MADDGKLAWMEAIRRLDAAYAAAGTDALAKMNGIEIHVLFGEKMAELKAVRRALLDHGGNEIQLAPQAEVGAADRPYGRLDAGALP